VERGQGLRAVSRLEGHQPAGTLIPVSGSFKKAERLSEDLATPTHERVIPSSGNILADLNLPDAAEFDTKARLGGTICQIVKQRRLSQADAAALLGVSQPKVSALLHFKLEGFSVELRFLDTAHSVRAKGTLFSATTTKLPANRQGLRVGPDSLRFACLQRVS